MYIPDNMQMEPDYDVYKFIHEFSFATIVSEPLEATHLPFLLNPKQGNKGTLYCHLSRANPHWKTLDGKQVLIIFSGPHAYISPIWYATKPAVPTWNYAAAHVYGEVKILNPKDTLEVIEKTVDRYEPELLKQPKIIPDEYRDKLLKGIVAFKITINKIEAKHKLGQHRNLADQQAAFNALQSADDHDSSGLLNYMLKSGVGVNFD